MRSNAPILLLIHGLGESTRAFDPVRELLPGRVVAVDLPGFGARAEEARAPSIAGMVAALAPVVYELASEGPLIAVGHSMGGCVATEIAAASGLLAGVVCVGTPVTVEGRATAGRGGEALVRNRLVGPAIWRAVPRRSLRRGLASAFAPGFAVPEVFVDDLARCSWQAFAGATAAIDDWLRQRPLLDRLAALGVPAGYLLGPEDQRITATAKSELRSAAGTLSLREIPGTGHTPMWEAPQACAAALIELVGELRAAAH